MGTKVCNDKVQPSNHINRYIYLHPFTFLCWFLVFVLFFFRSVSCVQYIAFVNLIMDKIVHVHVHHKTFDIAYICKWRVLINALKCIFIHEFSCCHGWNLWICFTTIIITAYRTIYDKYEILIKLFFLPVISYILSLIYSTVGCHWVFQRSTM